MGVCSQVVREARLGRDAETNKKKHRMKNSSALSTKRRIQPMKYTKKKTTDAQVVREAHTETRADETHRSDDKRTTPTRQMTAPVRPTVADTSATLSDTLRPRSSFRLVGTQYGHGGRGGVPLETLVCRCWYGSGGVCVHINIHPGIQGLRNLSPWLDGIAILTGTLYAYYYRHMLNTNSTVK